MFDLCFVVMCLFWFGLVKMCLCCRVWCVIWCVFAFVVRMCVLMNVVVFVVVFWLCVVAGETLFCVMFVCLRVYAFMCGRACVVCV